MVNPIGQMQEIYRMQKEAKEMQKKLQQRKVVGESNGGRVKIFMNAAQEYEDIYIDDDLLNPGEYEELKKHFKDAFKDFQKNLQKEMMKDFDMDKLKKMLGS